MIKFKAGKIGTAKPFDIEHKGSTVGHALIFTEVNDPMWHAYMYIKPIDPLIQQENCIHISSSDKNALRVDIENTVKRILNVQPVTFPTRQYGVPPPALQPAREPECGSCRTCKHFTPTSDEGGFCMYSEPSRRVYHARGDAVAAVCENWEVKR